MYCAGSVRSSDRPLEPAPLDGTDNVTAVQLTVPSEGVEKYKVAPYT